MKIRKRFLKSFAILMALFMAVQLGNLVSAETDNSFTEVVVNDVVDVQKAELIVNLIKGEELPTSEFIGIVPTANILCLFGHSMAQGTATEINHRYWATSPRCRMTRYRVDYCTRSGCDYMVLTQLGLPSALVCCP
jgi:D-aminopeptidase